MARPQRINCDRNARSGNLAAITTVASGRIQIKHRSAWGWVSLVSRLCQHHWLCGYRSIWRITLISGHSDSNPSASVHPSHEYRRHNLPSAVSAWHTADGHIVDFLIKTDTDSESVPSCAFTLHSSSSPASIPVMNSSVVRRVRDAVVLKGDEEKHEQTDAWSNRDLIPLPPARRTWGAFHFFGFWTLSSLNISTWQTPNTFLTSGLSVGQAMGIIVIARAIIALFAALVSWCGLTWHVGFTVQNRYTWGFRASYIPLLQRIMLNFIWNAVQCWTGGKLVAVCLTAIWPSFAKIPNTLPPNVPTTTYEMVGFIIFWIISVPFLFIRPENFKRPFQFISIYCGLGMICMMIWSLSVAKGVGPVFTKGTSIAATSRWDSSWLMLAGINQAIGQKAAGMTNGSDFSRYARSKRDYIIGTISCLWATGTLVSFVGLVTTAACQKIYGKIYWNPPDLLMVMMENGEGSSAARAGVFFLALGFGLTSMFENICGNAVAGGIDLAGLFPRYIDIRRGAIITFIASWIVQPWQLINRAATFIVVLNSFSVFLAPLMGVMCADYYLVRKKQIKLTALFHPEGSPYWYYHGINWRVIPAWIAGWAPTIGGLIVSVQKKTDAPRPLFQLYYMAFFLGFGISALLFYVISSVFPPPGLGEIDEIDVYGTFTPKEAEKRGVVALDVFEGLEITEKAVIAQDTEEVGAEGSTKLQKMKAWMRG
ncbi:NCS1 nucleoside transporter family protein-4 [Coleophoma cylindrospora]|uniref:NCS1 nucleoside transporter family protein-4 n=1 Tax=Coleophoma cylindrospora TaxID=1849047 RepID=A0A3D8QDR2_9HELO|nr:NCS1 nucleoside transporter family protein-4 [Coleophoma cylindrospora]